MILYIHHLAPFYALASFSAALFYVHQYFVPGSFFNIPHFPALLYDHVYSFPSTIFHVSLITAPPCKRKRSCVSQIYARFLVSNLESTRINMSLTIPYTRNFGIIVL